MEKENKTKENKIMKVKITVNGNDVEVEAEDISYRGLRIATLGLLGFVKEHTERAKGEIEKFINEELREEDFKCWLEEILHSWVDKACGEDYELRYDK